MPVTTIFFDLGETLVTTVAGAQVRFDDTHDVVQLLQERGYRLGLLSNQSPGTTVVQVSSRLSDLLLDRYIEAALITISTEIAGNVGKPAQPIFDLALSKAGHGAPSAQSIFVTEDAAHVTAARSFGWRSILVKRSGGACGPGDGECATSLTELLALLPPLADISGTNLALAPPPKLVNSLWAVPIDISSIAAVLHFDAAAQTVRGDATITFRLGRNAGCPVFDLRQTPTSVELDGVAVPISDIDPQDFGGGMQATLRVLKRVLDAGSTHTLRVQYDVGMPQASTAGSYPPQISWSAGTRLAFNFGFTDLGAGRYLEAFIPANLVYDQYDVTLEIDLVGTPILHLPITNGIVTGLGANHWRLTFPPHTSAFSPLLELRATDSVVSASHVQTLPVSGQTVTVTAHRLTSSAVDVAALAVSIGGFLADNESTSGRYRHGTQFTAFVNQGGMEYDGGTTSEPSFLRHEAFHSWWGRGVKPARQVDGWFDEAWTRYHDNGANTALALNFTDAPVELSPRNPWVRVTPLASYTAGERLFKGLAAMSTPASLRDLMNALYDVQGTRPLTTESLQSFVLARMGRPEVVDAFHRFVYGFADPSPVPDVWLRDDPAHVGGEENWPSRFWDSPDLWARNADDGGLEHQNPEYGQDNWLYARVRNRSASATARHVAVTFNVKGFAGSQFSYPADFLPALNAAVAFDIRPGESRILKALWPRAAVPLPGPGVHPCLLAAVFTRFDAPVAGRAVWEQNGLAQKNLTIVDLKPDRWFVWPFLLTNVRHRLVRTVELQVVRPKEWPHLKLELIVDKIPLRPQDRVLGKPLPGPPADAQGAAEKGAVLDCGGSPGSSGRSDSRSHAAADAEKDDEGLLIDDASVAAVFQGAVAIPIGEGQRARVALKLRGGESLPVGLRIEVPADVPRGTRLRFDAVQRESDKIVGGVAAEVRIT
jgi:FMN phosphatase YigB (HAD superfamily)